MKKILLVMALVASMAVNAFANSTIFTTPTVDITVIASMLTSILAALALLWAYRKAVKSVNKS